jgi:hypothetical protein
MVRVSSDIWRQDYYSECFFTLTDVSDDEIVRLKRLDVSVLDYEISVNERQGKLIFFLHLYFRPTPFRELVYEELFGNNN